MSGPDSFPARREGDGPPIQAHQSSVVVASSVSLGAQMFAAWKIIGALIDRSKWGTVDAGDFMSVIGLATTFGTTLFVIWKRIFRPRNRPIAPGPIANAAISAATSVKNFVGGGAPMFFLLALALLCSGCASSFSVESPKLIRALGDAEAEIAATDCVYLYRCLGPRPDLQGGQTCAGLLPDAKPTPGYAAPASCSMLYDARRNAKAHVLAAVDVAPTGTSAKALRQKIEKDEAAMKKADGLIRAGR